MSGRRRINDRKAAVTKTRSKLLRPESVRYKDTFVVAAPVFDRTQRRTDQRTRLRRDNTGDTAHIAYDLLTVNSAHKCQPNRLESGIHSTGSGGACINSL